ncbi:hypothetical protein KY290_012142 [Solanum tuberosum]|uniref:GBF-interacting protein 1 N-terminal domain-containing protein n=1 Tax=Solanum tuberosum TaxID=4113 RepID=A0ABQ7W4T6_SOLTU|nr:hypothetical protein KY289_012701 [Solanum tuberosum]KAH0775005.1 hypothetical protein KY290_012142 [Solanum tuberosum]
MVSSSKPESGIHVLSAGVREILESIKEVVGNHSDADIYVALKETNMDPNETAQKLLNQDPFHEVKRKRDRKKENHGYKSSTAPENGSYSEHGAQEMRVNTHINHNIRRGSYNRTALPDAGFTREFRVVRDNRVNQNVNRVVKAVQTSTSAEPAISNTSVQSSSKGTSDNTLSTGSRSSQAPNRNSQHTHSNDANLSSTNGQGLSGEMHASVSSAASQIGGVKSNGSRPHSITSSSNSVIGVYSSFSDPVHVPSLDSRPAAKVGAIKREVGVVGARRQFTETFAKSSSSQSRSSSNSHMEQVRQDVGNSKGSLRPLSSNSRSDQSGVSDSPKSNLPMSKSLSGNQHINRLHQSVGHQKAVQWKPKLTKKSSVTDPGVIGKPSEGVSLTSKSEDLEKEGSQLQDKMSRLNISENVIIAEHIRVSETDRSRLTFGSFGAEFKSAKDLEEESQTESSRLSVLVSESSTDDPVGSKQLDLADDRVQIPESTSPGSDVILDQKLSDNRESSSPEDLGNYADVGLVQDNSASYTPPESQQQQNASNLSSFSAYDPQTGYDIPYFRPAVDEALRDQGPQEALSSHAANSMPASSIPMVQQVQQHQPIAQMYPQVHVSHYANLMPYRHVFSPVYVPPMAMPGYSSNAAYPHPPNGSNYLLMPGGGSHLSANGLKYGIQQFKPVPTGSASGFGNFTSPTGYAINTPGVIGSATGLEDSSRMKYKDGNLYVPNPQAETSEMWMNPRDISTMQSGSYYSMSGQTPHATYLPSHSGHASFNAAAAAAAAQSSHIQFPGLYHPPQPAAMANPHHMGSAMAGNVGVGMAAAAPGAQVGAYQQPQLGHLNWTGNF